MHRRAIVYLLLLVLLSLSWGGVHSEEKHSWAVCIDNNAFGGHEFGGGVKQALLSGGWKESSIKAVKENSSDAFFNALGWLKNSAGRDDTILFHFSGHGYGGGIEMGMDKITYAELNEELDEIECGGMFIVLDACHSGNAIPFLKKEGRVIITSCNGNETSGYFSEPFINALGVAADCSGNLDGSVSAEEVFSYIMGDWYIKSYMPQMKDGYEGNLSILSAYWEGKKIDVYQINAQRSVENFGGERWLRQSFVPLLTPICGVSLKIAKWGNATDARIGIYNKNFSPLAEATIPVTKAHDVNGISTWISIGLHADVVPREKYFLVCKSNSTWWWWGSGERYENGKASVSIDGGNSWHTSPKISDFSFIIYSEDVTPPEIFLFYPNGGEALSGIIPISWGVIDNDDGDLNGSTTLFYSSDNGKTWHIIVDGIENSGKYDWNTEQKEDGHYLIKATAVDNSGNEGEDISDEIFTIDNTPPETTCDLYGGIGKNNWHVNKTTIMLSTFDALSGVSVYYKFNKQWMEYTKPLLLSKDGRHEFSYYGKDAAGNKEEKKNTIIKIDGTPPNISFIMPEEKHLYFGEREILPLRGNTTILIGRMKIKVKATDETSGISHVNFFMDGEQIFVDKDEPYEWKWDETSFFKHEIKGVAYDNAGNEAVKEIRMAIYNINL
ncbi:MAG: C13 family peptidase [Candidatus Thermoplasmatota archaeon]|nr:C13 family peptidase [Candidatus Thermoplasmatota archaeon]